MRAITSFKNTSDDVVNKTPNFVTELTLLCFALYCTLNTADTSNRASSTISVKERYHGKSCDICKQNMADTPTKPCGEGFKRLSTSPLTPEIKGINNGVKARRTLFSDHEYCMTESDSDSSLQSNSSKSACILKKHLQNIGF